MVYPLGVDVFSRKKHEKELQKAARCAVVFYVAMFQQIISELARLFDTERCSFLMVYPLGVDVFLSQKAQKGASKSRAVRGYFYVVMFQQIISELARLFDTERCSFLMVYPLGVDVFLSQKAQKGASKSRAVRGYFYVVMFQQIISELARLFDTERCSFLMVYPLGVDVFLSQKAQKGASKSRAVRGCFFKRH